MTFSTGIPDFNLPIVTPYGLATLHKFYEDGTVDLYAGYDRTFTVPASTSWRDARRGAR